MRSDSDLHEPRTNAEQSETGDDLRVSYESEEWRPVTLERFAGLYEVSNLGRVRSLHTRHRTPKMLTPLLAGGYHEVSLCRDSKPYNASIHRLVALAFHADKRNILHREVAHLDGSKTNNWAGNLKWVSHAENMSHKKAHGTNQAGERHPGAKLTDKQAAAIIGLLTGGLPVSKIAARFGVSFGAIDDIRRGKNWRHIPRPAGFERARWTGNGQEGEGNHRAKLTAQQVLAIRSMRHDATCRELGKQFGVSKAAISRVQRWETYRQVGIADAPEHRSKSGSTPPGVL